MTKRLSAFLRLALASLTFVCCVTMARAADYVITEDFGGDLKTHWDTFAAVRDTGGNVVVDGKCESACTLVLSVVPRERICATDNARFAFHAAVYHGTKTIYPKATEVWRKSLPSDIQVWTANNNAFADLKPRYLTGSELKTFVKPCTPAQAAPKTSQTTGQGQTANR
jgi:hypothetical protein